MGGEERWVVPPLALLPAAARGGREGGFGVVFKGILGDSTPIAVKRLGGDYQGKKQFRVEIRASS
ncbi:hypothetical protein E2562_027544 [Oryza meyeriana var. granulata]|uniref:Protein kinase domain-containing protein n=1 Tax=Oryza meyeriana var. granulata TaxID=110450 RepID=A0A6G1CJ25_9ORYZ|nr:hypothetical protein E2562_027544 [Oryza meyeriana var. granulata]